MAKSRFFGGAYDGLQLDHAAINAYCDVFSRADDGDERRKFVLLPGPDKWDDLVAGRISKDDKGQWGTPWLYQMRRAAGGGRVAPCNGCEVKC